MLIMISYPYQGCDNIASHVRTWLTRIDIWLSKPFHMHCVVMGTSERPKRATSRKLSESPPTEKSCIVDDPVPDSDFCLILYSWDPKKTFKNLPRSSCAMHQRSTFHRCIYQLRSSSPKIVCKGFYSTMWCDSCLKPDIWYISVYHSAIINFKVS